MPHSGAVRHSDARREAVRAAVRQAGAHVVQEQVGVGADVLVGERRDVARAGAQLRQVARRAADALERALTGRGRGGARRAGTASVRV